MELEGLGVIKLPKSRLVREASTGIKNPNTEPKLGAYKLVSHISNIPENIELILAKGNREEQIWNYLVQQHHYLGHHVTVGRCLKYLVVSESCILGAIAYSSPAWQLEPRDQLLRRMGFSRDDILNKVINNSRFLILPNVKVKNLASKILSLSANRVVADWTRYYTIQPVIAETFVQPSKFYGTCYKAANWVEIGKTKGYAKQGLLYHNSQEPKTILVYGLSKGTRAALSKALVSQGVAE